MTNITILDTKTGLKTEVVDQSPSDVVGYQYADGNWSCDCCRSTVCGVDLEKENTNPNWLSGYCQGEKRFLVIACDHPEFNYDEWNDGYPKELLEKHRP